MSRLFLDHNATTPLKPAVKEAMVAAMELGNPSSVHAEGRAARAALEKARETLAVAFDADPSGIIFTSGGTETINTALWGMVRREKDPVKRLFISAVEHDAALNCARAIAASGRAEMEIIPVTGTGEIDTDWLVHRLQFYDAAADGPFLVAVMAANNENGVIQPIEAVRPLIFEKGGLLFVDAVQAAGKLPISFNNLQADIMAVSGHKIAGPKGVGAMFVKPGLVFEPLLQGGGQELRRRVGTENVVGICGLGAAAEAIDLEAMAALGPRRDAIEAGLRAAGIDGLRIWGEAAARTPNTLCFSAPGFTSEIQVMAMDLAGIAVSAGSACSSGKVKASHVVTALGAVEDEAVSTLRVSLGWDTPEDVAERFLTAWQEAYCRARKGQAA